MTKVCQTSNIVKRNMIQVFERLGYWGTFSVPSSYFIGLSLGLLVLTVVLQLAVQAFFHASWWALVAFIYSLRIGMNARKADEFSGPLPIQFFLPVAVVAIGIIAVASTIATTFFFIGIFTPGAYKGEMGLSFFTAGLATIFGYILLGQYVMSKSDDGIHALVNKKGEDVEDVKAPTVGCCPSSGACVIQCCWVFVALVVVMMTAESVALENSYLVYYPGDESIIDIGDRNIEIRCSGYFNSEYPPVFFVHGLGGSVLDFSRIQPEVAKKTRTCSYGRAGYGFSDKGPYPRNTKNIVEDMEKVVEAIGFEDGFMFVGHSFAGTNMRYYQSRNPEKVLGIVFVDAVYAEFATYCERGLLNRGGFITVLDIARRFGPTGAIRLLDAVATVPGTEGLAALPSDIYPSYINNVLRNKYYETRYEETVYFSDSCSYAKSIENKTLDIPVSSIGAGDGIWRANNQSGIYALADLSSQYSSVVIVPNTTHDGILFEREQSQVVVEESLKILELVKYDRY